MEVVVVPGATTGIAGETSAGGVVGFPPTRISSFRWTCESRLAFCVGSFIIEAISER